MGLEKWGLPKKVLIIVSYPPRCYPEKMARRRSSRTGPPKSALESRVHWKAAPKGGRESQSPKSGLRDTSEAL